MAIKTMVDERALSRVGKCHLMRILEQNPRKYEISRDQEQSIRDLAILLSIKRHQAKHDVDYSAKEF